jgi:hypothetical protein
MKKITIMNVIKLSHYVFITILILNMLNIKNISFRRIMYLFTLLVIAWNNIIVKH